MTDPVEVRLPQYSMGVQDALVLVWHKGVGEEVAAGDELVEVDTAKANDVITAPAAGVLTQIVAPEGSEVTQGQVLAIIEPRQA